ncbi:MAG: DUF421 domain-containing protein, partial [Clostridia bacterium]|nr:DUF421 domain-containing protein [Clostridia bacterium]
PNELVTTIFISQLASMPIEDREQPILSGVVAILLLVVIEIFISYISMKSSALRGVINGKSAAVIKDGVIDQKLLKKLRITITDLLEMLRQQQVFNIDQVSWAILETSGNISVLLKPQYRPATANDVSAKTEYEGLPAAVVCDGVVMKEALSQLDLGKGYLDKILQDKGKTSNDYLLVVLDKAGNNVFIEKEPEN